MGQCNFCLIQSAKRRAKKERKVLIQKRDPLGSFFAGQRFYSVIKGKEPTEKDFIFWCAEVSSGCVC